MLDALIHSDYKQVDKRDPLQRMQGYMEGTTKTRPIICDGKTPFGVPNRKALMRTRVLPKTKIDKYAQPVPVLSADEDHLKLLEAFADTQADYLPITRDGKLVGYVEAIDLLDIYETGPTAAQAAERVPPLEEDTPMKQAILAFRGHGADHMPVLDANGRISGVLHRNVTLRLESQTPHSIRQTEWNPQKHTLIDDKVEYYMSRDWAEAASDAPFAEVRELLKGHDHVFVPDLPGSSRTSSLGVVSAPTMVRACLRHVTSAGAGVYSPTSKSMRPDLWPHGPEPSQDFGHNPSS